MEFVFRCEALDNGVNQVPVTAIALDSEAMPEVRSHVVVEIVQAIRLAFLEAFFGKRL